MVTATLLFTSFFAAFVAAAPRSTDSDVSASRRPHSHHHLAPLVTPNTAPDRIVKDSYIVVLKNDLPADQLYAHISQVESNSFRDSLLEDDGGLRHVYDVPAFKGYAGKFGPETVSFLRSQPEVAYVEKNQIFHTTDVEKNAPWGLARISHRKKLSFSTFRTYLFDGNGGAGVDAYVIDTGIYIGHSEFEGRAKWGKTMPKNDTDTDGNGHGTHCAGTIASKKYGVAKKANLIAVKVLGSNGSGTTDDVIGGVIWAAKDASAKSLAAEAEFKRTGKRVYKGAVANMSLGGGKSDGLDAAVNAAVAQGLHFAVAAGNENQDACNSSPARATSPITVGASTVADERAYFSNHGPCVDVFAPGLNILSTWTGSPTASNTISGTSMASPHTVGLLAYLLSIYPSVTFNPPEEKLEQTVLGFKSQTYSALFRMAKATLPGWMTAGLYMEELIAPIPPTPAPLTPALLKKALLALSTPDALAGSTLPGETINLLIFNNATSLEAASFWASL